MVWCGGLHDFSVNPSPLETNLAFELGWPRFGSGLGDLRTQGLGPGLDNLDRLAEF